MNYKCCTPFIIVGKEGFEPPTSSVSARYSKPTELLAHKNNNLWNIFRHCGCCESWATSFLSSSSVIHSIWQTLSLIGSHLDLLSVDQMN